MQAQLNVWAGHGGKVLPLGLLDGACVTGFAWGLSHLVTALFGHAPHLTDLAIPGMATFLSLGLRAGLSLIVQRRDQEMSRRIVQGVRHDIMAQALAGRLAAGANTARLNSLFEDSEALEAYYARFRQAEWQARVIPVGLIVLIVSQSPVCAGLLAITLVPFVTLMAILGMGSADESRRQLDALARLSNLLLDRIRALPLILAFQGGTRQTAAVAQAAHVVAERTLRVLKIAFLTSAVLEFFSALSVALIAVYCGFYLLGLLPFHVPEHLTFAKAFFVLALAPEVYAPMRRLAAAYHDRQGAIAAAQRLMAFEVAAPAVAVPPLSAAPAIAFRDVVISHADDPDFRIGPISFTAGPGSVTALAGPTGSGKTSLLRRLLEPQTSGIEVNGLALPVHASLAGDIAWVSQNSPIVAGTLRDNLRLANQGAGDDAIATMIDLVGLRPLVEGRTGGLDNVLDERGAGLSGGERRRIVLARALLKPAPILLLDEPTADLDAESEADLIARLPGLFKGRTVIFSSHSSRLCALASQIVRLA